MPFKTFFSGGNIQRASEVRQDATMLQEMWEHPDTRFVVVWQSRCLVAGDRPVLLRLDQLGGEWTVPQGIYLGRDDRQHLFALSLPDTLHADGPDESAFDNFRSLLTQLGADDAALLAYAKGMIEWQQRHLHCGRCGAPNMPADGGFVMTCSRADCGARSFPRLDPAIIVLTRHEDRALLGRQTSWPENRYSTIAGFVEPGESLEDAVAREVHEETNVQVEESWYLASQPWPFPNAIMLGFHARAATTDIRLNDGELADARWLSREELTAGDIALPPPQSIAFRLIEHWFDEWDGPPLDSFKLSTEFRQKPENS
jgi:NAD+ diphosphatase